MISIGVVAPSSPVSGPLLELGATVLRQKGFSVTLHPQCFEEYFYLAGADSVRFEAFLEFALDPGFQALWVARGGYGSMRLLRRLDEWTRGQSVPPPRKWLLGYSDATALLEFVRTRWGWPTVHAATPGQPSFALLPWKNWSSLLKKWLGGKQAPLRYGPLECWTPDLAKMTPASSLLTGTLRGGNLSLWTSLLGTPFLDPSVQPPTFLFLEEVHEPLYRIDRMLQQLALSGALEGVQAILLGNFLDCQDSSPKVPDPERIDKILQHKVPSTSSLRRLLVSSPHQVPLRSTLQEPLEGLRRIFSEWGDQTRKPVWFGLPCGHGPEQALLPLSGGLYQLIPSGVLQLVKITD